VAEGVTLLVLEKGSHRLGDGTLIEVGTLVTNKLYVKGFESIGFDIGFATAPTILSQVQTFDGTDFIISRQRAPSGAGFELTMQEEEADNRNHFPETVGWLAVEHGGGALPEMTWQAGSSAQNVNGRLTAVSFNAAFETAPLVVASLASYNGTDTASPRIGSVTASGFSAMALEDQSKDLETFHGYEIIDWLAFSNEGAIHGGDIAPQTRRVMETGTAVATDRTTAITFGAGFFNPVVIATMTSANEGDAAVARVSNVTATGFDLRIQETDFADGLHGPEDVSWIVLEAGSWMIDGTLVQAGTLSTGQNMRWGAAPVVFDAAFSADPAVLVATQTAADPAFVKARMTGRDSFGFAVGLEEEEAASWGPHAAETIGWIALERGVRVDADGALIYEAGVTAASHTWAAQGFADPHDAPPALLAGISSFVASDPANARVQALGAAGFEIRVEEDPSLNPETSHGVETFDWAAFDGASVWWGDTLI
jgi:hypothetical protein